MIYLQKITIARVLVLCLLAANSSTSVADIISVPTDYLTIQSALDAAISGDEIVVLPGIYVENIAFAGKNITLRSLNGAQSTTIRPNTGTVVDIGPQASISGFTISNEQNRFGSGMVVHGVGTIISRNVFSENFQGRGAFGAAISGNSASPIIRRNVFTRNTCDSQFHSGVVAFVNISSPRIENNIFYDNLCRAINFTLPSGTNPEVINNTLVKNHAGIRFDARVSVAAHIYRNNILFDNGTGLEVDHQSNSSNNPVWENNLVFSNHVDYAGIASFNGSAGNISVNPAFKCADANNFGLLATSPAVNAGSSVDAPVVDYSGQLRQGIPDIGAFEQNNSAPLSCPPPLPVLPDNLLLEIMPTIIAAVNNRASHPEWGVLNNVCCQVSSTTYTVTQGVDQRSSSLQSCSSDSSFEGFIPSTSGSKFFTSVLSAGGCGNFPIDFNFEFENSLQYLFELSVVDGFLSLNVFTNPLERSKNNKIMGKANKQILFPGGGATEAGYRKVKTIRLTSLLDRSGLRNINGLTD